MWPQALKTEASLIYCTQDYLIAHPIPRAAFLRYLGYQERKTG
jgi:hypothetical protein